MDRSRPGSWSSISLSVLLHGAIALLVIAAYFFIHKSPPRQVRLAIDATVVNAAPQAARPVVPEPVASPPIPDPVEQEQKQEQEQIKKQEAEKRASEKRQAEEKALQEKAIQEKAIQDKAARDKAALAKATEEKEAREKAEKEKAEKAKAEKEKAAQEKLAREKTQVAQRSQREADLNAQIAAEERAEAARNSGQMNQYIAQITAKIERSWTRPVSAQPGLNCEVRVTQVPGGTVTAVQVGRCNGDESVRQSIETAVLKASPLPPPSDPALFERILVVTFKPDS
jgi:colicin import membrane protein